MQHCKQHDSVALLTATLVLPSYNALPVCKSSVDYCQSLVKHTQRYVVHQHFKFGLRATAYANYSLPTEASPLCHLLLRCTFIMHLIRSLVVPVLAFLLAAGATALDPILEHRLGRCPCHIRITGYASERAPISLQVIKLSVYRHWVRSGRPHEIIRKTSYLKPGPWSSNSRISSHGAWVLLVHSSGAVTAKVINAETANRNNEETVNQRRKE
eukprot:IDg21773t1